MLTITYILIKCFLTANTTLACESSLTRHHSVENMSVHLFLYSEIVNSVHFLTEVIDLNMKKHLYCLSLYDQGGV